MSGASETPAGQAEAAQDVRPNILWIIADELRADTMGCYGAKVHDTPNLDRMAAEGVTFTSAHTNSPECVPSRASFMTGKYAKTVQVFNNHMGLNFTKARRDLAIEARRELGDSWQARADASYDAIAAVQDRYTYPVPPAMIRGISDELALRSLAFESGAYEQGSIDKMLPELLVEAGNYRTRNAGKIHHNNFWHGFQEVFKHPDEDLHTPFGVLSSDATLDEDRLVFLPTGDDTKVIGGGVWPLPEERNPDRARVDDTISFLQTANGDQPWLARLSLIWPHTPVLTPEPWDRRFDPDQFPLGAMPTDAELRQKSRYERQWRERTWAGRLDDAQLRRAWADYWGLASYVDHLVGRVLDALAHSRFADNTLVIFTADHGVLLGEHCLWQKEHFYDPVVKVPLLMKFPGRIAAGTRIEAPVELVDIVPTVLDYVGLPIPADVDGVSLVPTISGDEARPHDYVFSEYVNTGEEGDGWIRRMVTDGEWRLEVTLPNVDGDLDPVLYHLPSDPDEVTNQWGHSAASQPGDRLLDAISEWCGTPA